jgi:predicted metalloprotease with PDZ domain
MEWTGRLYERYAVFFKDNDRSPYAVFLRPNPINPGGGIGQEHSFVATFDDRTGVKDLKLTLAHEMLHTFIGGLNGDEQLDEGWFSEGLAVYYQRTLPLRFGQISLDDFLIDLNETAGRYYTNALANTPNSEIPAHFWSNTLIRVLPYDRGALYFATVNDAIRKQSQGKRSLDDLVMAMLQRRREKGTIQRADWQEVVSAELGERGRRDFQSMLEGRPVLPAPDAFGPCLRRTTRPLRRYELGFDPTVRAERKRIVRGLSSGSAAERAGLRNGDEIARPFGQDAVQADQSATLTVEVVRNGKTVPISYLPRGETVAAYQWERMPHTAASACNP